MSLADFEDPVLELATNLCEIVLDIGNYIFFFFVVGEHGEILFDAARGGTGGGCGIGFLQR